MEPGKLKPYRIPHGFKLVVDTREQLPLFQDPPGKLIILREKLDHGDYSIKGFEDQFAVERKMLSDFYGYIGKERKRTVEKLKVLGSMQWAALIVECEEDDLLFSSIYTQLTPEHARQALVSMRVRYGIHVYISSEREKLERFVLDHAIKFYRLAREV